MKNRIPAALFFVFLVAGGSASFSRAEERARVVCFGDSITKRGYPAILSELLDVESINAGVAGHTSGEGLRRMQRDVLEKAPDVVVILFGTNDLRVDNAKKHIAPEKYRENLVTMVKGCRERGAKVVLCTLPPINAEPFFQRHDRKVFEAAGGLTKLITELREAAVAVAEAHKVPLVDFQKLLATKPQWMSPDGVHPSGAGNKLIAEYVAKAIEPLLASSK